MNKAELVEEIAKKANGTKASAEAMLQAYLDAVTDALIRGDAVTVVGFGTLSVGKRAARTGRNPATGDQISIPATRTIKFSAGQALKKAVNTRQ